MLGTLVIMLGTLVVDVNLSLNDLMTIVK